MDNIENGILNACPTGMPADWLTSTPPTGWLVRDGSAISRTTYADLFAVLGTTYGVGNGSTTFNLPDDRDLYKKYSGTSRTVGTTQSSQNKSHIHAMDITSGNHWHNVNGSNSVPYSVAGGGFSYIALQNIPPNPGATLVGATYPQTDTVSVRIQGNTESEGGTNVEVNNRAYLPIIKY